MIVVSVCLPSDSLSQHLPSCLGFSYLGRAVYLHDCSRKHSRCSLSWTRAISSRLLLLKLKLEELLLALLGLRSCRSLDMGLLLAAASPDLGCGVSPLSQYGVITHLEPEILEYEVKWALESITTNKASGSDGIPVELFQILKDDSVKVLHSVCWQIWKTQQ